MTEDKVITVFILVFILYAMIIIYFFTVKKKKRKAEDYIFEYNLKGKPIMTRKYYKGN